MACETRGDSPYFLAMAAPTMACEPSCSWSTALPMSWRSPARRAILTFWPSSAAMRPERKPTSTECASRFCAWLERNFSPPSSFTSSGCTRCRPRSKTACSHALRIDLRLRLGDDLFDAGGVDAAVGDQAPDRQARDLAPDRVEARDRDRLGRVVDDHVDAGGGLERAHVAALATDEPALQ